MTQLCEHFALQEFSRDGRIPESCHIVLSRLCLDVLEPVRAHFGVPLTITSGYRPPEANAEARGQPNSEHIYSAVWAAADFALPASGPTPREVFDWMRWNPSLPYHQLILEHGQLSTVIHVSMNTQLPGMRSVLEGATHNSIPYIQVDHADYAPQTNFEDVQTAAEGT